MNPYIYKRIIRSIVVFFIILIINFILPRAMPGNPASILANQYNLPAATVQILIKEWKLDAPLYEQFIAYIKSLFTGQWGYSYQYYPRTVYEIVMERLPWTLLLQGTTTVTVGLTGILLGILAGWRRGKISDTLITLSAVIVYAIPYYWLALLLQYFLGYKLRLFPISQALTPGAVYNSWFDYVVDVLRHLALPVLAVTLTAYASYTLITRNTMIDLLGEDFVFVSRAMGLPENKIMRTVARNAMLPPITMLTIRVGYIIGGAVITETIFSYPGLGYLIYQSIIYKDYPVLNAAFFMLSVTIILANLAADFIYMFLDPRIRYGERR